MTTDPYSDAFVDRLLAEAKAQAKAEAKAMARRILRVLAARGLHVTAEIRERVLSCADISRLEVWADRAATADSVGDVFGS